MKESGRIANEIRRQIYQGRLRSGDKLLPEKDLLVHFGVSRPTLREALRLLESEQLITIMRGGGGVRVQTPDANALTRLMGGYLQRQGANLEDIFAARLLIEPQAAGLLARNAMLETIVALEQNVARSAEVVDDLPAFNPLIIEFSALLVGHCGNRTIALMAGMVQDLIQSQIVALDTSPIYKASGNPQEKQLHNLEMRRRLIEAVKTRDADQAVAVWRASLELTRTYILSAYRAQMPINVFPGPTGAASDYAVDEAAEKITQAPRRRGRPAAA